MFTERPFVLSIAGFDPCGGAGLLADIKTFEALRTYGLGVVSALTVQNDVQFESVNWLGMDEVIAQTDKLFERFEISVCKVGIMPSVSTLLHLLNYLKQKNKEIQIVVDPVLKSSSGFSLQSETNQDQWKEVLRNITLLTPNYKEMQVLSGSTQVETVMKEWSKEGNILLKGGHHPERKGWDLLYLKNSDPLEIEPFAKQIAEKHGSGCVLSAAIAAYLALGNGLTEACRSGKIYTERFLNSQQGLLGYHF